MAMGWTAEAPSPVSDVAKTPPAPDSPQIPNRPDPLLNPPPSPSASPSAAPSAAAQELLRQGELAAEAGTAAGRRKAVELCQQAAELYASARDPRGEATALLKVGDIYLFLGEIQKALESHQLGLEVAQRTGDEALEGSALERVSESLLWLKQPQQALPYLERAEHLVADLAPSELQARIHLNMAAANELLGKNQEAIEGYLALQPLFTQISFPSGEAAALNNLGTIYYELGELEKSADHYRQALAAQRKLGDRSSEARGLANLGAVLSALGDQEGARQVLKQALAIHQESGDQRSEANTLNGLGEVLLKEGSVEEALQCFLKAETLAAQVPAPRIEAFAHQMLGNLYTDLEQFDKALGSYQRALALRRASGHFRGEADTLASLAATNIEIGDLSKARSFMAAALEIVDSQRKSVTSRDLRTSLFASRKGFFDFYIHLLMTLHQRQPKEHFAEEALQLSERTRARSLLDQLAEAGARIDLDVDPALIERQDSLRARMNSIEKKKYQVLLGSDSRSESGEQVRALEQELRTLQNDYSQNEARIRFRNPRYAAISQAAPLTAKEIQETILEEETILLEYSLGEKASYLWAVSETFVKGFQLPPRQQIEAEAERLYRLLTARNQSPNNESPTETRQRIRQADSEISAAAEALSTTILAPAKNLLGNHRLVIVAEGMLQYLPFGVLTDPSSSRSDPLLLKHEIIHLPSSSSLLLLRKESARRLDNQKEIAIFADPVFTSEDSRVKGKVAVEVSQASATAADLRGPVRAKNQPTSPFRRLRFSRFEAEAISDLIPEANRLVALDFSASNETVTSLDLRNYRMIHFATHAIANDQYPNLSGLVLSLVDQQGKEKTGFLRLHDIYNLNLNADLVTLSACETALGQEIRGEGLIGLTRGFMHAGASRVVSSLWEVQDKSTAELMKRFYEFMILGDTPPSQALRRAQISMFQEPRWKAPYFWSAFIFQGEWR